MAAAPIIHINGHPGTGKLTIARALSDLLPDARLLDNHTLLDPARALFDRGTAELAALRQQVRDPVFAAAATLSDKVAIILTDCLDDTPLCKDLFRSVTMLQNQTKRPLCRFILDIDEAENVRRITHPDRAHRLKLRDPQILIDGRETHRILDSGTDAVTHFDVTTLSAKEAAAQLLSMIKDRTGWKP